MDMFYNILKKRKVVKKCEKKVLKKIKTYIVCKNFSKNTFIYKFFESINIINE